MTGFIGDISGWVVVMGTEERDVFVYFFVLELEMGRPAVVFPGVVFPFD